MKILSSLNFKGGVGKTTSLMSIASAAVSLGESVVVIDTDVNRPMGEWADAGVEFGTWSDRIKVEQHMDFGALNERIDQLETAGKTDLVLIDPRGGRSDFHNLVAQICDFILIPTSFSKLDADQVMATIKWLKAMEKAEANIPPFALLFSASPTDSAISATERDYKEALSKLPHVKAEIRLRQTFKKISQIGLLGKESERLGTSENPMERGQASPYRQALADAVALYHEINEAMAKGGR